MRKTFIAGSTLALLGALPAFGQTTTPAPADTPAPAPASTNESAAAPGQLEDIVVTAQKRSENLQRVPIAITALTSQQIARSSITTTNDLTFATPGLNFSQTGVFAQPFVRGIGTDSFSPGNEASVATYVDGVYIANMSAAVFGLANIERIEVLKGPQGTLYGRNSTGGLVNVITATPTQKFQAQASASYGNYDIFEAQGFVSGGILPWLAGSVSASVKSQGDGFYRNVATGNRVGFEDGLYLRSKLVGDFGAAKFTLAADFSKNRNTLATTRQPAENTVPALAPGTYSTVPGDYYNTRDDRGLAKDYGFSGTLAVDLDSVRLVSITAYRRTMSDFYQDQDDSSLPLSETTAHLSYRQFTQELQVLSPSGAPFDWILGAFYLNADAGWDPLTAYANGVQTIQADLFSGSRSIAGFGQATFRLGSQDKITVGGRYTYDKKDYRRSFAPGDVSTSWTKPTWRFAYSHDLNQTQMLYATYNRGYKSGVYNTLLGPPVPVNPESVDSFELGFKGDLIQRRLRVNVAAFYSDFRNIQVRAQQPGNITIILQNAAAARIYGIDSDVSAIITEDLRLQLGFSWIHGRYEDFQRAEIYVPLAAGGNRSTVADVTGNRLPRTPEFSGNVNIAYDHTYSDDSHIYGNTNLYLTDDIYWEPSNRIRTKAYGVLNGTLGYTFPGGVVSVELFGRNLTDRRYANYVVPSANADRTSYAPPRTFGVRALFRK